MTISARCSECSATFERGADERWKKLCLSCFKAKKRAESGSEIRTASHSEINRWMQLYFSASDECARLRIELEAVRAASIDPILGEIREQLPRLLMCCHPDRHDNSEASNRATTWLLEVKRRLAS